MLTRKNLIGLVAFLLSVKTILICRHNDVTLTDVELQGKGSTDCEHSNSTLHIISGSGLEIFVCIKHILTKLFRYKLVAAVVMEHCEKFQEYHFCNIMLYYVMFLFLSYFNYFWSVTIIHLY